MQVVIGSVVDGSAYTETLGISWFAEFVGSCI
jgi:hypothetical protein